jgi:glycyl-tRNA synthetase
MELEYFVDPGNDEEWHDKWVELRLAWWEAQGVPKEKIKLLDVEGEELAHYSKKTVDLMYEFPHGLEELEGIANRTDFDLGSHSKNQGELEIKAKVAKNSSSNAKLAIQELDSNKWVVPFVIEPSAGVERAFLAILNEAYREEELNDGKTRVLLSLKPHLAPIKAAVIPLKKNNKDLVDLAYKLKNQLQNMKLGRVVVENTGNIGKSYRKHDEIGTPVCITVDFDSLEKNKVTLRDRDDMSQESLDIEEISSFFQQKISS